MCIFCCLYCVYINCVSCSVGVNVSMDFMSVIKISDGNRWKLCLRRNRGKNQTTETEKNKTIMRVWSIVRALSHVPERYIQDTIYYEYSFNKIL